MECGMWNDRSKFVCVCNKKGEEKHTAKTKLTQKCLSGIVELTILIGRFGLGGLMACQYSIGHKVQKTHLKI